MKIMIYGLIAVTGLYLFLSYFKSDHYFSMKFKCDGREGVIKHWIYPSPISCQKKMYAITYDLNQSCKNLKIVNSYCGL